MTFTKQIQVLLKKELLIEWRQKFALNGMLLYVISTVYVCYMSFKFRGGELTPITWNAIFWIVLLFTAMNAVAKSFMLESKNRQLYYYVIHSPQAVIVSKIIYNTILMVFLGMVCLLVYSIVLGNPVQDMGLFILNVLMGSLGFSSVLTMIAAIAAKAANGGTLMAVMGFPVIIPMLLMLIKISKNAMDGLAVSQSLDEILVLGAINLVVLALTYLLFPYLWRG